LWQSVIIEDCKTSKQNPGDSCIIRTSDPRPPELVSKQETHSVGHNDPLLLTTASELWSEWPLRKTPKMELTGAGLGQAI
jgi:hypothetical protein